MPGWFYREGLTLDFCEERFQFHSIGRGSWSVRDTLDWASRFGGPFLLPAALTGELLAGEEAILLITGDLSTIHTVDEKRDTTLRDLIVEPSVRAFCLLRREEIKGWRGKPTRTDILSVNTSEFWMVPVGKAIVRVGSQDPRVHAFIRGLASMAGNPRALDSEFPIPLPRRAEGRKVFATVISAALFGIVGFVAALTLAMRNPPGSTAAVTAIAAGMSILLASLVSLPVILVISRARMQRRKRETTRALRSLAFDQFVISAPALAGQFVDAANRRGVRLDFTPGSLSRLTEFEPFTGGPRFDLPSTFRYAAFLGEVLARDLAHRERVSWSFEGGSLYLKFPATGISIDVYTYARGRVQQQEPILPQQKYSEWRNGVHLGQAVQPRILFEALGLETPEEGMSLSSLRGWSARLSEDGELTNVVRPFAEFVVRSLPLGPMLSLKYQAIVRREDNQVWEEPRCLRPILRGQVFRRCTIEFVAEWACDAEATIVADFGGPAGEPLVVPALVSNYLFLPAKSLGGGQIADAALSGVVISGEFLTAPPLPGHGTIFGSAQATDPANVHSPFSRVKGVVATVTIPPWGNRGLYHFELDIGGVRVPMVALARNVRGEPRAGLGFSGEACVQAEVAPAIDSGRDVSIA